MASDSVSRWGLVIRDRRELSRSQRSANQAGSVWSDDLKPEELATHQRAGMSFLSGSLTGGQQMVKNDADCAGQASRVVQAIQSG